MSVKLSLKVPLKDAEKARQLILSGNLLDFSTGLQRDSSHIFFPLVNLTQEQKQKLKEKLKKEFPNASFVKKQFKPKKSQPNSLREALKGRLTKKEFSHLITSFDSVGTIAVIEIPPELEKKEKIIAKALLETNRGMKTVCKITGGHKGKFRIQPVKVLAGENTTIADYKESGCSFKVDISKTFFSPRLSHERERISKLIKKGEVVGAFFAGVGPFPIVFAKNSQMKKAYAIELNPDAFEMMQYNISLNKVEDKVEPILGDVNELAKQYPDFFDRIAMPLPRGGEDFLEAAVFSVKPKGTIHFYQFVSKESLYNEPLKKIGTSAKKFKRKFKVLRQAPVRSFSATKVQIVIDFKVM